MALLPIAPGNSLRCLPRLPFHPRPYRRLHLPRVSSDTVNAPITVDSTGLVATVAIPRDLLWWELLSR